MARRYSKSASKDVASAMRRRKKGALRSGGSGKKIKERKPGPCDHLRQGSGKGPYRGGAHGKTSKPRNDQLDSHHMPAKDASPLPHDDGPAIQMTPKDHGRTSSNGQMPGSVDYREAIAEMIEAGEWRNAMAREVRDVRRVARESGDPTKYNEAMLEMLEYFKCLEKNPQNRYATAADLAADLNRFLRHEPPLAQQPGIAQRMRRWTAASPLPKHAATTSTRCDCSGRCFSITSAAGNSKPAWTMQSAAPRSRARWMMQQRRAWPTR